ncbi:hypothetical protein OB236_07455 [Paenibacillus sp. WQ 127069]|uniref:Uncharacterized protein n=1 Tax=Paenibacillus baimaensis TaxID=2982185 RepID=A0ABT2UBF2_9BACL|nr:hypothetical protein [Paenibacillus sp. WQ 127069]
MRESDKLNNKIKNFELITSVLSSFCWIKFNCITEFHFYKVLNKFFDEVPILDFTMEYKEDVSTYIIKFRFKGIENLQLSSTTNYGIQLSAFEVTDIREDGWCDLNYKVNDYESHNDVMFYCNEIEVISITRL